ncbi:MAG: ATP-binding cassette domain-containing protein [Bacteroidales bacterium]|jgi:ABC-2 type transport system ATP-binding protein|nr:ATP-binding cassette domain-containing protein [Bacteroidales bacterium]
MLFEAKNIVKRYAGHTALDGVSISIPEQSIFGLLGPNGAGKTTLIRIINQIIGPDEGELFFDGRNIQTSDIYQIGYLPEERGLYKKMKVGEQAIYLAQLKGLSRADAIRELKVWFEKFDIGSWWNKKVEELSKGMQQKIQFIITIIHKPKLLIFDEPFSGFDPINVQLLKKEILNFKNQGASIIFSTHNMASVEEICDHISLIDQAKTILEGEVSSIKNKFKANIYEVEWLGQLDQMKVKLPSYLSILDNGNSNGSNKTKFQIGEGSKPNDLMKFLMDDFDVLGLKEILPSMDEIFIQSVNATSK